MMEPLTGVSRETILLLKELEAFFLEWTQRMNLAASSTREAIWTRHILDSAQLIQFAPNARRWLDLGSGGGFPGLVLAILLRDKRDGRVELVESSQKKSAFLNAAIVRFDLPARVHAVRIEKLTGIDPPDAISARALAPLDALLELASPWLLGTTRGLFHKGRRHQEELAKSSERWCFELAVHPSMTEEGAAILEITNLRPRAK